MAWHGMAYIASERALVLEGWICWFWLVVTGGDG